MAKPKQALGRNGFKYREQYGIIILCEDAKRQQRLYDKLKAQGYTLRVVTV
jgi:hypothetical protein